MMFIEDGLEYMELVSRLDDAKSNDRWDGVEIEALNPMDNSSTDLLHDPLLGVLHTRGLSLY